MWLKKKEPRGALESMETRSARRGSMERGLERAAQLGSNRTHDRRGRALDSPTRALRSPARSPSWAGGDQECKEERRRGPALPGIGGGESGGSPGLVASSSSSGGEGPGLGAFGFFQVENERGDSLSEHLNRLHLATSPSLDAHLSRLSLGNAGARDVVRFLMRGMPVPATFGYPDTDGSWCANYAAYLKNINPIVSPFGAHPMHPFSRQERAVVWYCSTIFLFGWSLSEEAAAAFYARRAGVHRSVSYFALLRPQHAATYGYLFVRLISVILYAILIRQLVICPCLYKRIIDDIARLRAADDTERRAKALVRRKRYGDYVLIAVALAHTAFIANVVAFICRNRRVGLLAVAARWAVNELKQQAFNVAWQTGLFLALFPVHRAMWFAGGSYADYARRCRSTGDYRASPNYRDPNFPRCVASGADAAKHRGAVQMAPTTTKSPDNPFQPRSFPVDASFV